MTAVALEVKHGIDHVFDDLWPGDLTILRHMADKEQRAALRFGVAHERLRCRAHLADGSRRGLQGIGPERLD